MNPKFKTLSESFFVAPQITAGDLRDAGALGVTLIVNNRPDGEEPGQPAGADLERAAKALGLYYVAIPIAGAAVGASDLDAFDKAVAQNRGATLAFCRSGTRSTLLRAYARARAGAEIGPLIEEAAEAGYDLSRLAPQFDQVRRRAGH